MAVGMTANEYISKLNKENPTIDTSDVKYINNRTRISVSCKVCGHKWTPVAGTLVGVNKTGCRPCGIKNRKPRSHITADEWWERSSRRYDNKYTCDLSQYIDQNTPLNVICPTHGAFSIKPVYHMHNSGCSECGKYSGGGGRAAPKTVIAKIHSKFPGKYTTDKVNYITQYIPITLTCKEHGDFEVCAKQLFKNNESCPGCLGNSKTKLFIERAVAIHGNKYDYSETKYVSSDRKLSIRCPKHGVFTQRADTHVFGKLAGCHSCGKDSMCVSQEEFLERVGKLHPSLVLDKVKYIRSDLYVTVKCKKHGYFKKVACDLLRLPENSRTVNSCPICSSSLGAQRVYLMLVGLGLKVSREWRLPVSTRYRYDFYLQELNLLIEYDGMQHYYPIEFWGGVDELAKIRASDTAKNKLAKQHNIPLIRIPYTKDATLEEYLLWKLSKLYKYRKDGVFYKNYIDLIKNGKLPADATVDSCKKYKTINININIG